MTSPVEQLRENIMSATALVVIGLGLIALALGVPYFWVIFAVGLFVIVPLIGLLFGADDWRKWDPLSDEFWEDIFGETDSETETKTDSEEDPQGDPLTTLRDRYAQGKLTDEQFERKLELLLETESIEDVQDQFEDQSRSRERVAERE